MFTVDVKQNKQETSNMGNQNNVMSIQNFPLPTYLIFILSPYNISSAVITVIIIFVFNYYTYFLFYIV